MQRRDRPKSGPVHAGRSGRVGSEDVLAQNGEVANASRGQARGGCAAG